LDDVIQENILLIKKEYKNNVKEENYKLLLNICKGENLDFSVLQRKYLKTNDLPEMSTNVNNETDTISDTILNKITINGNDYYYEPKENGIVYNSDSVQVGIFSNGKIVI
jgi:TATA-box binding protein (TBP) (component of TFIID and TFIIIB)